MNFINLKDYISIDPIFDLNSRFNKIDRIKDLANSKVTTILDSLSQIISQKKYFGAYIFDEHNDKRFIFVDHEEMIPNFVSWMSSINTNQLRDIVNRINFIYNTEILNIL